MLGVMKVDTWRPGIDLAKAVARGLGSRREVAGTEMYLERETLALIEEAVMERRGPFLTPG